MNADELNAAEWQHESVLGERLCEAGCHFVPPVGKETLLNLNQNIQFKASWDLQFNPGLSNEHYKFQGFMIKGEIYKNTNW